MEAFFLFVIPEVPIDIGRNLLFISQIHEMQKLGYVYIMSNVHRTVLYIGVTSDLENRVYEHEEGVIDGFTKKYNCHDLIYYEILDDIELAIRREKAMKKWNRAWKERQIKEMNPDMKRLNDQVFRFN